MKFVQVSISYALRHKIERKRFEAVEPLFSDTSTHAILLFLDDTAPVINDFLESIYINSHVLPANSNIQSMAVLLTEEEFNLLKLTGSQIDQSSYVDGNKNIVTTPHLLTREIMYKVLQ